MAHGMRPVNAPALRECDRAGSIAPRLRRQIEMWDRIRSVTSDRIGSYPTNPGIQDHSCHIEGNPRRHRWRAPRPVAIDTASSPPSGSTGHATPRLRRECLIFAGMGNPSLRVGPQPARKRTRNVRPRVRGARMAACCTSPTFRTIQPARSMTHRMRPRKRWCKVRSCRSSFTLDRHRAGTKPLTRVVPYKRTWGKRRRFCFFSTLENSTPRWRITQAGVSFHAGPGPARKHKARQRTNRGPRCELSATRFALADDREASARRKLATIGRRRFA